MEFLLMIVVGIIVFSKLKKNDNISNTKNILYSILLFIPLVVMYYFIIALVLGLILSIFGDYMHYYGIILGIALSPLAAIITIIKINSRIIDKNDSKKE